MSLKTTKVTDTNDKAIFLFTSNKALEEQTLLELSSLNNATSSPEIDLSNIVYEINGNMIINFENDTTNILNLKNDGNWGMKPNEDRIRGTNNLSITSTGKFKMVLELQKVKGFN